MRYNIIIQKQAKKKLLGLPSNLQQRIAEKIHKLGCDPDDLTLDVKKLVGSDYYRLRVGDWRIIYDRDDEIKIISIEALKSRGDVYK
jgi:mRNA interferase RelE/StbE